MKHNAGKSLIMTLALTVLAVFTLRGENDSIPKPWVKGETVGLVLSGGGAKGIAHVGVIKALEENDIPIDYVTGTSMGAIVGSLYSCGWSPEKMMAFFTSDDFQYWSTGTINKSNEYYFTMPTPTPKWLSLNVNFNDSTNIAQQVIPSNLISPLPMNIEFLKLYLPYTKQCDENFNHLFVPFRCVASDVYHKHKVVFKSGSLGDAVRASMSFPLVFKPITIDGVLMYDGGIYDNFPVNVMQSDFKPDFMIGVSVSSADTKPIAGDIYSQLEDMIIQNNDYSLPAKDGVKIQVPVLDFGVLDFGQAKEIYEIGYKTGLAMVDSIKYRVRSRIPLDEVNRRRIVFAGETPTIEFDSVKVMGATPTQADYLDYLFTRGKKHTPFSMDQTVDAYYRAVTNGKLSDLLPQAWLGRDNDNTLLLYANVKKPWNIGVGGWITSSTNSMLYLNFGYHTLSFNSLDVDLSGWIGQSYYAAMLSGKFSLRTYNPSCLKLEVVLSRQKYYDSELLFYQTSTPTFITETENFLRMNYCWAIGREAAGSAGVAYGYMSDSYFPSNTDLNYRDKTQYKIGMIHAGFEKNTLNDQLYPNQGMVWRSYLKGAYERNRFIPGYGPEAQVDYKGHTRCWLEMYWKHFYPLHKKVTLGTVFEGRATLENLYQNYTATLIHAAAFEPTPSTKNYFNEAFRSDNYLAVGLIPVWSPVGKLQLRGDFYGYSPVRNLVRTTDDMAVYDGWFKKFRFIGEVAAVYNFPFASLSIYCNYLSYPARNWNFGINFGLLFMAPKLAR